MKKVSIYLVLTLLTFNLLKSQDYIELGFHINQNGNQLLLDSVYVENISNSSDTMLYYPDYQLTIDVPLNVEDITRSEEVQVRNYPNPFGVETNIEVILPVYGNLKLLVYDTKGRLYGVLENDYDAGLHRFRFSPGAQQNYIVRVISDNSQQSLKLISSADNSGEPGLIYDSSSVGAINTLSKNFKTAGFSYSYGDNLQLTAYSTACGEQISVALNESPESSQDYYFDFTDITNIQPEAPQVADISKTETSITWQWGISEAVDGYKINNVNDYASATDVELNTSHMQTDLIEGTNYFLYVWAYNHCGESFPLAMHAATLALPLNSDELDLILEGTETQGMQIMNIFEQPDSIILRSLSTNVIIGEEHLEHFHERLLLSGKLAQGVGIAAPQVGINRRIICVQRHDAPGIFKPWGIYYNPRITQYSETFVQRNDGCLSVPSGGEYPSIDGYSYRATWVEVEYYLPDGTHVIETINHQFTAHIFQHEVDHLDGIMYFDLQTLEEKTGGNYTIIEGESYDEIFKE
jgi:peptide deformylase